MQNQVSEGFFGLFFVFAFVFSERRVEREGREDKLYRKIIPGLHMLLLL